MLLNEKNDAPLGVLVMFSVTVLSVLPGLVAVEMKYARVCDWPVDDAARIKASTIRKMKRARGAA
jgi:hypothetical protein